MYKNFLKTVDYDLEPDTWHEVNLTLSMAGRISISIEEKLICEADIPREDLPFMGYVGICAFHDPPAEVRKMIIRGPALLKERLKADPKASKWVTQPPLPPVTGHVTETPPSSERGPRLSEGEAAMQALEDEVRRARETMEGHMGRKGPHPGQEVVEDPLANAKADLREMPAKELKKLANSKGIDTSMCVEKEDLIKKLLGLHI